MYEWSKKDNNKKKIEATGELVVIPRTRGRRGFQLEAVQVVEEATDSLLIDSYYILQ